MTQEPGEGQPQTGRSSYQAIATADHAVLGGVESVEQARLVIQDLEEHGIPTTGIELIDVDTDDPSSPDRESDVAESEAMGDLSRSTIVGGAGGAVIGALLGLLMAYLVPGLGWGWGMVMGAVFGSAIGGAAGGMSVAKYASPAWDETFQVSETGTPTVAVHYADGSVVDAAEDVFHRHDFVSTITRLERGRQVKGRYG